MVPTTSCPFYSNRISVFSRVQPKIKTTFSSLVCSQWGHVPMGTTRGEQQNTRNFGPWIRGLSYQPRIACLDFHMCEKQTSVLLKHCYLRYLWLATEPNLNKLLLICMSPHHRKVKEPWFMNCCLVLCLKHSGADKCLVTGRTSERMNGWLTSCKKVKGETEVPGKGAF